MTDAPAWLRREISAGLQALVSISLDNQPAAEILPMTADVWLIAVQRGGVGISIEEVDAPRIREGFRRLFPLVKEWPKPRQLIEQIPGRPERQRLPAPPITKEEEAEGLRQLRAIKEKVNINVDLPFPSPQETEARRRLLKAQARMIRENQP